MIPVLESGACIQYDSHEFFLSLTILASQDEAHLIVAKGLCHVLFVFYGEFLHLY